MRLAIVGTRTFTNYDMLAKKVNSIREVLKKRGRDISIIVSGGRKNSKRHKCTGADLLAERYAKEHELTYLFFEPDWDKHSKAAGPIRNAKIVSHCDMLLAFWDGESTGTIDSVNKAKKDGKMTYIIRYK